MFSSPPWGRVYPQECKKVPCHVNGLLCVCARATLSQCVCAQCAQCVCVSAGLEIISADLRHKNWTQEHTTLRPLLRIRGFLRDWDRQEDSTAAL